MTNSNQNDEDYLAPFETAARIYCNRVGVDPDEVYTVPSAVPGMFRNVPRWRGAAEELLDLSIKLSCLRVAMDKGKTAVKAVMS